MTTLNYVTILTSLTSIAINGQLILRPALFGWKPQTARAVGGVAALLAVATIVLTITNTH